MQKTKIYDLPTRFFHLLFSGLFIAAYAIAKTADSEGMIFLLHMFAGLCLGFVIVERIVWGFIGTKHSRFSDFVLHPSQLISYLKGVFKTNSQSWAGHNPASSWGALVFWILGLALVATGILMTTGSKEEFEDAHELIANLFLVNVAFHILGLALHSLRHKDGIAMSMVTGKKQGVREGEGIASEKRTATLLFLVLTLTFMAYLYKHFDTSTKSLNLFGVTLQLGENDEK